MTRDKNVDGAPQNAKYGTFYGILAFVLAPPGAFDSRSVRLIKTNAAEPRESLNKTNKFLCARAASFCNNEIS